MRIRVACFHFKSSPIMMEEAEGTQANPICLSDSSPVLTEESPVKLLSDAKRTRCR